MNFHILQEVSRFMVHFAKLTKRFQFIICYYEFKRSVINRRLLKVLFLRYAEKGLRILAFPCNQFGGQEPGSEEEIKEFVKGYGVEFDMFSKIDVNGPNAHPLYVFLKNAKHGTLTNNIKWNFTKFLCDKQGVPVKRYSPTVSPLDIVKDIEKELNKG